MTPADSARTSPDVRVIAYYRLPEGAHADVSGENLPEWTAVRAAPCLFAGHDQPQIPGEFGYCNVRDRAVRKAHAALARDHGISAFCYVLRWPASGSLHPTLADIVGDDDDDFPFCLCWQTVDSHAGAGFSAEEAARARRYTTDESIAIVRALLPAFADRRYLRVRGRPLFVVSSPDPILDVRNAAARWRDACVRAQVDEPILACYGGAQGVSPAEIGFDATVETPPLGGFPESRIDRIASITPGFDGDARSYRSYVAQALATLPPEHAMFRCVMPGWDATPREGHAARIFVDGNPETFGYWAERVIDLTRLRFHDDQRVVFVRAWNEWDAGCHLEPDERHGRAYLQALANAVFRPPTRAPARPPLAALGAWAEGAGLASARVVRSPAADPGSNSGPRVSVIMPAYNHERYVAAALDSVCAQSHANLEIIVIDDGSSDTTPAILDDYAARCVTHPITVVHQGNAGAPEAFNHGLSLARGEIISLINSDDLYAPDRLERVIAQMEHRAAGLGFSGTRFIDDEGRSVDPSDPYVTQLTEAIREAIQSPNLLYVLVYNNIAISTGNFVFRRSVLEQIGGFCSMQVCHDWDFLLGASLVAPLTMVEAPLYFYRLHGANTYSRARLQAAFELEQLVSGFLGRLSEHPLFQDPERAGHFLEHLRKIGLSGYVR